MRKIPKNPNPNLTLQNRYSPLKNKPSTQKEGNAKTKNEQFNHTAARITRLLKK